MSDLLWPGLHRDRGLFTDGAVLGAIDRVETVWAHVLEEQGLVPPGTGAVLRWAGADLDLGSLPTLDALAVAAEAGGNPLIPWLDLVRTAARDLDAPRRQALGLGPDDLARAAAAIHRGLTSQDVVDTALVLCAQDCLVAVVDELDVQVSTLADLAERHRDTPAVARTLGQHALPTTFGLRVAGWLDGLVAARTAVLDVLGTLPAQVGGAVGTLAALVELCRDAGRDDPVAAAQELAVATARGVGLAPAAPWHTGRAPMTRIGDVLVTVSDALGHVANDVVAGARSDVGELSEPAGEGRGVSSAMPQKRNPVLSVLVRRHAMSAPLTAAQLHLAAAAAVDERPDGAWHTEWAPLRDLSRRTVAAASQLSEVVTGLEVHVETMRRHLDTALPGALAERLVPALAPVLPGGRAEVTRLIGASTDVEDFTAVVSSVAAEAISAERLRELLDPMAYMGVAGTLVDEAVARARLPRRSLVPEGGTGWWGSPPGGYTAPRPDPDQP